MKLYKVYEILDNMQNNLEASPKAFAGCFISKRKAEDLQQTIKVMNYHSSLIEYGPLTTSDLESFDEYGCFQNSDCVKYFLFHYKMFKKQFRCKEGTEDLNR